MVRQWEQDGRYLVVVGVDASPESVEAARFAADEAAARGLDLLVVHAVAPGAGRSVRGFRDAAGVAARRRTGQSLVDHVLSQVHVAPRTRVHTAVEGAPATALLTAWTGGAAVLVLGQHHVDLADGRLAGQVAPTVTASARCPVVIVPAGWTRATGSHAHPSGRPVVVGVGGRGSATTVLQLAYAAAERRRSSVLVLHASARADPVTGRSAASDRAITAVVAEETRDHPDIPTDYRSVPAATVLTWVEVSSRASLMVLGRPFSVHGRRSWKHSVAQAMLHQARCPLMVVPPSGPWALATPPEGPRVLVA